MDRVLNLFSFCTFLSFFFSRQVLVAGLAVSSSNSLVDIPAGHKDGMKCHPCGDPRCRYIRQDDCSVGYATSMCNRRTSVTLLWTSTITLLPRVALRQYASNNLRRYWGREMYFPQHGFQGLLGARCTYPRSKFHRQTHVYGKEVSHRADRNALILARDRHDTCV